MTVATKKKAGKVPFTIAQYRAEGRGEPIPVPVDEERVIEIERPSFGQMMDAEESQSTQQALRALCGDQADELLDEVRDLSPEQVMGIIEYIQRQLGLGE